MLNFAKEIIARGSRTTC